ncbi:MAG TPA: hypoxanthine phosphoribosyltransferase [Lunatimonas sp.]|nr:hypoxanthine phosphoribosyltransferase [Lunatimonas sp.]
MIFIHNKPFTPYLDAHTIQGAVDRIALQICKDYAAEPPVLLGVLNGAFMFLSDLVKKIDLPVDISFMKIASYSGISSTGKVEMHLGVSDEIKDRHVIVVEDIVDTGRSMAVIQHLIRQKKPKSIAVASLLHKPDALIEPVEIKYLGFSIEDKFVVGYGLDFDGIGRNLPEIFQLKD